MGNRNRIVRVSTIMCVITVLVAAVALIAVGWMWGARNQFDETFLPALKLPAGLHMLDADEQLACLLITSVPMLILQISLYAIYQLFSAYRRGDIFTRAAARRLRLVAFCVGAMAIVRPVTMWCLAWLITNAPPSLLLYFNLKDLLTLFFAGVFYAIALVLAEAVSLREENEQFL